MQFIDLKTQYKKIEADVQSRLADICEDARFIMGREVGELEQRLADYTGAKYAVACGSGTDALQIALMALDLQPGDEVITTPFTFFATGEVIALLRFKPVFVDICEDSYNINAAAIEEKITDRTKAIIPVSLYGQCADMDEINAVAAKYGLPVIEDAAQSFGAEYKGRKSCNVSTIGTASFFPSKPLGCYGDGGMVFTSDEKIADALRSIRNHGQEKRYYHNRVGVNSRLDTMQAAVLLAKMEIFEDEIRARARVGQRYGQLLGSQFKVPVVGADRTHVYAQYTIEVDDRDEFCARLKEKGVPTAVHYPMPLHFQPVFSGLGFGAGDFPVAERVAGRVVSLPMHPYLDERAQDEVVDCVMSCGLSSQTPAYAGAG